MNKNNSSKQVSVKSVTEYINIIFDKVKKLENIGRLEKLVWFRGESSEDYKLTPNLFRIENSEILYCADIQEEQCNNFHEIEQNIDASFARKAEM